MFRLNHALFKSSRRKPRPVRARSLSIWPIYLWFFSQSACPAPQFPANH